LIGWRYTAERAVPEAQTNAVEPPPKNAVLILLDRLNRHMLGSSRRP